MSRRLVALSGIALLLVGSRVSAAQSVSTITVSTPSVGTMTISAATAGQEPGSVSTGAGTYTVFIKKNGGLTKITARAGAPLPTGFSLSITLASPGSGATSLGAVSLTTAAQPVVTNVPNNVTLPASGITYLFTATSAAGVLSSPVSVILELAP